MSTRRATIIPGIVLALVMAVPTSGRSDDEQKVKAVQDAVVNFGQPQPQSAIAQHTHMLVPNEVTINKGGTVTFRVNGGGHGIALYPVSKNTVRDDITAQLCPHGTVVITIIVNGVATPTPVDDLCTDTTFMNGDHTIVDGKDKTIIVTGTNPPIARVDDPTDRLLATSTILNVNGTLVPGAFLTGTNAAGAAGNQIQYRFAKTGRYLAICMNRAHSLNDWMFGFVNVVDADDNDK